MAIQGLRTSGNFATDQRPKNWREGILMLYPNGDTPLTGLTSQMKSRSVDDPEFNWWEKSLENRRHTLHATSGDLTTTNTSITLAAGSKGKTLKDGDILWIEQTDELVQVNGDPTSDTVINVIRGVSGSTPATLDANGAGINPNLTVVGSAYEEGSNAPTGIGYDPTKRYNYTQIFRDTLEATRTATKTKLRTGDQIKEAKRECLEYHAIGMERAFFLGKRYEGTKNGKPWRTLGGIKNVLDTLAPENVKNAKTDYSSGVTMRGLEEYMYNIFKYGSSEKVAFCGNRALLTVNQIVRKNSQFNIVPGIKEYGMDVTRLVCPFGTLVLKTHPLFNQTTGGTTTGADYFGMESWMFVLDMKNIQYVTLTDGDTKYQPKLEDNGVDGMQSGYLTECSLEVHHAQTHYLIKSMHTGVVDAS